MLQTRDMSLSTAVPKTLKLLCCYMINLVFQKIANIQGSAKETKHSGSIPETEQTRIR